MYVFYWDTFNAFRSPPKDRKSASADPIQIALGLQNKLLQAVQVPTLTLV